MFNETASRELCEEELTNPNGPSDPHLWRCGLKLSSVNGRRIRKQIASRTFPFNSSAHPLFEMHKWMAVPRVAALAAISVGSGDVLAVSSTPCSTATAVCSTGMVIDRLRLRALKPLAAACIFCTACSSAALGVLGALACVTSAGVAGVLLDLTRSRSFREGIRRLGSLRGLFMTPRARKTRATSRSIKKTDTDLCALSGRGTQCRVDVALVPGGSRNGLTVSQM